MDPDAVKEFYRQPRVLEHYAKAASSVGLWLSEEKLFTRFFQRDDNLLELGTGAGRIAFGLELLGYKEITAIDLSKEMIGEARYLAEQFKSVVKFMDADALALPFEEDAFDGAIFGFNGLMQIPGRERRRDALREVQRVVKPGACFVFTTHDREFSRHQRYWKEQRELWNQGLQNPELLEFGDRYEDTPLGKLFIHVPTANEVREDLLATGWRITADMLRSRIANEPLVVREFSDECRFWIVQKRD